MSATTIAVAIWVADIFGFIAYRVMVQRDRARALVRRQDQTIRDAARRNTVLRDEVARQADVITFLTVELHRVGVERDHARTTLEIQIADPRDRMALLPSNVVALRKGRA